MIGFDDNYCLCNIFTIKFLFLTHTQAQLHVDGVPIGDHAAPEVIDDWALHSVAGLQSTKLVVGACWMGEYRLGVCWMPLILPFGATLTIAVKFVCNLLILK